MPESIEMQVVDLENGWTALPGFPDGIAIKTLSGNFDEMNKTGRRTRLVRLAPGVNSGATLTHDYWEEALILSGDLSSDGTAEPTCSYSIRSPGTPHGPFTTRNGCILLEVQYYQPE